MSVRGANTVGGAERTAGIVAGNLAARGHQVSQVSLGARKSQPRTKVLSPQLTEYHVPLVQLYDPYGLDGQKAASPSGAQKALWHLLDVYNPAMGRQVEGLLRRLQPDIVLTHTLQGFSVAVWSAVRKVGAKLVHMTHDHALICPSTAMTKGSHVCETVCGRCAVYSHLRHAVAPKPDAIVGPSEIILKRHQQFGWFKDVPLRQAIPNAMPADWPAAPPDWRPGVPMVFGFLGRLDESKGLDTLLKAIAHLSPHRYRLKVAGRGDLVAARAWLGANPDQLPIEFVGAVKGSEFLQGIDVLVTPSRAHETFCNVVMEAACLGRPAIVSDSGALPERVDGGATGWVVPAGDELAMTAALQHCLDNPNEVAEKGRRALATRPQYDAQHQCDLFEALLQRVLAGPASGSPS